MSRLADSSLLTATGIDATDQARFRPHDLIREYAAERLAEEPPEEEAAALGRVTDGWLQLAGNQCRVWRSCRSRQRRDVR